MMRHLYRYDYIRFIFTFLGLSRAWIVEKPGNGYRGWLNESVPEKLLFVEWMNEQIIK
jgi:hypothetical protein